MSLFARAHPAVRRALHQRLPAHARPFCTPSTSSSPTPTPTPTPTPSAPATPANTATTTKKAAATATATATAPAAAAKSVSANPSDGDDDSVVTSVFGTSLRAADHSPAVVAALDARNGTRAEQAAAARRGIVARFRRSPSDTGSPEVQIAVLTDRIARLTEHMLANRKDTPRKRTMSILVNQRRRMMQYLLRKSPERYGTLVAELGLRPSSVFSKDVPLGAKKAPGPVLR